MGVNWCAACEVGAASSECPECGGPMDARHPGGITFLQEDGAGPRRP